MTSRVGIINLMPKAEAYETSLLRPLVASGVPLEPVWIRLESHAYSSSDPARVFGSYQTFERAVAAAPLDGLVVSGAPVEELAFDEVVYFRELAGILEYARATIPSTLGLCWGGLALASLLGLPKVRFDRKLFGVFPLEPLVERHPVVDATSPPIHCPQSRHSGIEAAVVERAAAAGVVRPLARSPEVGDAILESADGRYLMHLGHPEYDAARLAFEYERDLALGRTDVEAPRHFDTGLGSSGRGGAETWAAHRADFFTRWMRSLARPTLARGDARGVPRPSPAPGT